eukprot:225118_1
MLSSSEKEFISVGVEQNLRNDGRGRLEFRQFTVQTGHLPLANGSAELSIIGGPSVLVGIKLDLEEPSRADPEKGLVECTVQCSSTCSQKFIGNRTADDMNAELSSRFQKFIGDSEGIDRESLCVRKRVLAWKVQIDAVITRYGGSIFDAIILAARAALKNTRVPKVTIHSEEGDDLDFEVNDDAAETSSIDVNQVPLSATLSKIGRCFIADPTEEEEQCTDCRLFVSVDKLGTLRGVEKTGEGSVPPDAMLRMIENASTLCGQLIDQLDNKVCSE